MTQSTANQNPKITVNDTKFSKSKKKFKKNLDTKY